MVEAQHNAAAAALAIFQKERGAVEEHAIADLMCDLGHVADKRGLDFLDEAKRAIGHWLAERHVCNGGVVGPDVIVEITIAPK